MLKLVKVMSSVLSLDGSSFLAEDPGNIFLSNGRKVGTQAPSRITLFSTPAHLQGS